MTIKKYFKVINKALTLQGLGLFWLSGEEAKRARR